MPDLPADYVALDGSERRPSPGAAVTGPADPGESFTVSIVLRRRPDGPPVPDFSYYARTPRPQRRRLSREDFAAEYGAADDDIAKVVAFVTSHGLQVVDIDAAARTVKASGTALEMSEAFAVTLQTYEHEVTPSAGQEPVRESYRGRDGKIYVPRDLAPIMVGVFGLDNRRVTKRNNGDPPSTQPIPFATFPKLYNFPAHSAAGHTIAILSEVGYLEPDISATFGGHPPTVTSISVDASNDGKLAPRDNARHLHRRGGRTGRGRGGLLHHLLPGGLGRPDQPGHPSPGRRSDLPGALLEFLRRQRRRPANAGQGRDQLKLAHRGEHVFPGRGDSERHGLHRVGRHRGAIEDAGWQGACPVSGERPVGALRRRHQHRQRERHVVHRVRLERRHGRKRRRRQLLLRQALLSRTRRACLRRSTPIIASAAGSRTSRATPAPTPDTPAFTWTAFRRSATAPAPRPRCGRA